MKFSFLEIRKMTGGVWGEIKSSFSQSVCNGNSLYARDHAKPGTPEWWDKTGFAHMKLRLQKETFTESSPGISYHAKYSSFNDPYSLVGEMAIKQIITALFI